MTKERFKQLVEVWHRDTGHLSLVSKAVKHAAYQEIIAAGLKSLPFIFEDLRTNPDTDFWCTALQQITGKQLVGVNNWLAFAKQKGWLS